MSDVLLSERDMAFLLDDWLGLETHLAAIGSDTDRETVSQYLDLSAKLAADRFLTHYKKSDHEEPRLENGRVRVLPEVGEALREFAELGLFSASFPAELGGMGLPYLVTSASYAWFAAANGASVGYAMLTGANARLIAAFGSEAQRDRFALPQIEGRWFGTMCLSEPQAGSSLGDIRTRAVPDGSDEFGDRYRLTGNKMWISGGDQDISENIVHLVLAKVPGEDGALPEGTEGISLFIVPKILPDGVHNDIAVAGLNHKMGNRGTSNCLLNFGEGEGATGWIVGKPGQGLAQMFMMMNEARVAVGLGAASLACRGYLLARDYAKERLQGRAPGVRDGTPVAIVDHADIKRMLIAAKAYSEGSLALCLYAAKLVDEKANPESTALLDLLTPVVKTYPSEFGRLANDLAIQVHGGYGYTRDFDVEQLYRDNRLNPIHEGTTGIQAGDLLGRKILGRGAGGFDIFSKRAEEAASRAADNPDLAAYGSALADAIGNLEETIVSLKALDPARRLDNSALFLEAFGHVVLAWLWLEQALAASSMIAADEESRAFAAGKIAACRYYFEVELPKSQHLLALVGGGSTAAASLGAEIF